MKTRCWNSPKPSRVTVVDAVVRKSLKQKEKAKEAKKYTKSG